MLKDFFKYGLTLALAFYFLIAGTGYNIVNYCCETCESEGIEYVSSHSCADIHQQHAHHSEHSNQHCGCHKNAAGEGFQPNGSSCELIRINVDIPVFDTDSDAHIHLPINELHCGAMCHHAVPCFEHENINLTPPPPDEVAVPLTGREILSEKSVLTI